MPGPESQLLDVCCGSSGGGGGWWGGALLGQVRTEAGTSGLTVEQVCFGSIPETSWM